MEAPALVELVELVKNLEPMVLSRFFSETRLGRKKRSKRQTRRRRFEARRERFR